tara:strand:- start:133 stop:573 length:441 start_codon:yes stop_codon:yes gene_type:complete
MISIQPLTEKDIDLCYKLDSNTISLWTKKQWSNEFKREGVKIFGLLISNFVVGVCAYQVVHDEAQINYFVVNPEFRKRGYGSFLMSYLIELCEKLDINKILLEVSQENNAAQKFYDRFDFSTVGIRRNYYKDGSNALLKEKQLLTK